MTKLESFLEFQYNQMPPNDQSFIDCFPVGKDHAIPARDLAKIIGTETRTITRRTKNIIAKGYPICSGDYGYYIPDTALELRRYLVRETARNRSHQQTLQAIRKIIQAVNHGKAETI